MNNPKTRMAALFMVIGLLSSGCNPEDQALLDSLPALESGEVNDAGVKELKEGIELLIEYAVALYDKIVRDSGNEEEALQANKNRATLSGSDNVG